MLTLHRVGHTGLWLSTIRISVGFVRLAKHTQRSECTPMMIMTHTDHSMTHMQHTITHWQHTTTHAAQHTRATQCHTRSTTQHHTLSETANVSCRVSDGYFRSFLRSPVEGVSDQKIPSGADQNHFLMSNVLERSQSVTAASSGTQSA